MATKARAFNLRDRLSPRDLQDIMSDAVSELVGGTAPGASGYAANPHTLSGATHTGIIAVTQATQFAYNEANGADDASDRSAYNANRMTGAKAHVAPATTDTYDLGTSTKLWRQANISQINATIFAENVIQLVGGYQIIGHGQGSFTADVGASDTFINFGMTMTGGDFILIKAHDAAGTAKTEYMQILGTDHVQNAGFETAGAGGSDVFANWVETAGDGTIVRDNTDQYAGTYSCKLTGGNVATGTYVSQTLAVKASTGHTLTFWHWDDGNSGQYAVYDLTHSQYIVAVTAMGVVGAVWTEKTVTFTTPADCVSIRIDFFSPATFNNYCRVDTVYLQQTAADVWSVTRDLAAAHGTDPAWTAGTPFLILGTTGDGRIELDAYNTPRISLITQGATYSAQTEMVRIGDLNANWGYVAETYGVAIGEYDNAKANVTIDATNGVRLRSYQTTKILLEPDGDMFVGSDVSAAATTQFAIFTNAQTYNSESVSAGDLLIGDNTSGKANIFWDKSAGKLQFRGGTTMQAEIGTDGGISFGAGTGVLNGDGITITPSTAFADLRSYSFDSGSGVWGGLYAYDTSGGQVLGLRTSAVSGKTTTVQILATGPQEAGETAAVELSVDTTAQGATLQVIATQSETSISFAGTHVDFTGGLNLGTGTGAAAGGIYGSGNLRMSGLVGFGMAPASGVGLAIQGVGATSSTYVFSARNSTPANQMYLRDDGYPWVVANWNVGSDAKLKSNIRAITGGLDAVKQLKPTKFDLKSGPKNRSGFIAQELQAVLPDLVTDAAMPGEEPLLSISYGDLIPYLVQAIQEQQAEIEKLKQAGGKPI